MKRWFIAGVIGVAVVFGIIFFASHFRHVDIGSTGILLTAADKPGAPPNVTIEATGSNVWLNPFVQQDFEQYPTAVQSLVLASNSNEGELPGNSTISCQMNGGGVLNIGMSIAWQVNPAHPEVLFFKRPHVDLTSSLNNDIATTTVLGAVQSDAMTACTQYTWEDILGDGTGASKAAQLQHDILTALQNDLRPSGILVNQVFLKERNPSPQVQAILDAKNKAQASGYQKVQAQNNADAQKIAAQGNSDAEVIKAKGDAQSIQTVNQALANNPEYLKYLALQNQQLEIQRWDGHLPQYYVNGSSDVVLSPFSGIK